MNSRWVLVCVFGLLITGGGCSMFIDKPKRVVLKHPQTLDFVNCNVDKWETTGSYRSNEECIRSYREKGYFIWDTRR